MRYELRNGKFGMYFYDTLTGQDLSLREVLDKLNNGECEQYLSARHVDGHSNGDYK